jgi:hypothetical protein
MDGPATAGERSIGRKRFSPRGARRRG